MPTARSSAASSQPHCHGEPPPGLRIEVVGAPDRALRRQHREPVAKALHASAFVVDGDEQRRRAQRADLAHQLLELLDVA